MPRLLALFPILAAVAASPKTAGLTKTPVRAPAIVDFQSSKDVTTPQPGVRQSTLFRETSYRVIYGRREPGQYPEFNAKKIHERLVLRLSSTTIGTGEKQLKMKRGAIIIRAESVVPATAVIGAPDETLIFHGKQLPHSLPKKIIDVGAKITREVLNSTLATTRIQLTDATTSIDAELLIIKRAAIWTGPFKKDLFWWPLNGPVKVKFGNAVHTLDSKHLARIPAETAGTVSIDPGQGSAQILQVSISARSTTPLYDENAVNSKPPPYTPAKLPYPSTMANFCGAWSVDGLPVESLLSQTERLALRAQLVSSETVTEECLSGRVWLSASPGLISREGSSVQACLGTLVGNRAAMSQIALTRASPLAGHFSFVCAEPKSGALTLLRDPSGGEKLFFCELPGLILFSTSLSPLLACGRVNAALDEDVARELLLNGVVLFGERTLALDIREVRPGYALTIEAGRSVQRPRWRMLGIESDGPLPSPQETRADLREAVQNATAGGSDVAVALSGGIDSAIIAALAVEALGPRRVHAFTYEFDDAGHQSEANQAADLCRHLGLSHEVVKLSYADLLESVPAVLRLTEDQPLPSRARLYALARRVGQAGLRTMLTGEALTLPLHPYYMDKVADLLLSGEAPPAAPFAPPSTVFLLLGALRHNALLTDDIASLLCPPRLRPLVLEAIESERVRDDIAAIRHLPLAAQLKHLELRQLQRRFTEGKTALCREGGATALHPAALLYPKYAQRYLFFPTYPKSTHLFSGRTRHLLVRAMEDLLPKALMLRPKLRAQALPQARWFQSLVDKSRAVLGRSALSPTLERYACACAPRPADEHIDGTVLGFGNPDALRLWSAIFLRRNAPNRLPSWSDLAASKVLT